MGMKANSGLFYGTRGSLKYNLDIQLFSSKKISPTGRILLKSASNRKLKNTILDLYRPGAKIGDGGTAAAIKRELKTGELVGGKSHLKKGKERIKNLDRLLKKENLSKKDRIIALKLKKDLEKALGDKL